MTPDEWYGKLGVKPDIPLPEGDKQPSMPPEEWYQKLEIDPMKNIVPALKTMAPEWSQRKYEPPVMDPNATPGKVGPGEISPLPESIIDVASNIPSFGGKGLAGAAMKGIFAGPMAKTANKLNYRLAEEMFAKGFDRRQIWDATQLFQGKDGMWRHEISDEHFFLNPKAGGGHLGDLNLVHPGMQKAYPDLSPTYRIDDSKVTMGAYYRPSMLDPSGHIEAAGPTVNEKKLAIIHELMHAVQNKEGFAKGGSFQQLHDMAINIQEHANPGSTNTLAGREEARQAAFEVYNRIAGEVEARNVEKRLNMSMEERKRIPPWETEDRPRALQQVIFP